MLISAELHASPCRNARNIRMIDLRDGIPSPAAAAAAAAAGGGGGQSKVGRGGGGGGGGGGGCVATKLLMVLQASVDKLRKETGRRVIIMQ
jgi:hypothetical protein